jgi:hypothetical protein
VAGALAVVAAGQMLASDLSLLSPPPRAPAALSPITQVYNWGGVYFGFNLGYGLGNRKWSDPANFLARIRLATSI